MVLNYKGSVLIRGIGWKGMACEFVRMTLHSFIEILIHLLHALIDEAMQIYIITLTNYILTNLEMYIETLGAHYNLQRNMTEKLIQFVSFFFLNNIRHNTKCGQIKRK